MNQWDADRPCTLPDTTIKSTWLPLFTGVGLGVLLASGIILGFQSLTHRPALVTGVPSHNTNLSLGGEINGIVPEVTHHQVQFWNDSSFVPTYDIVNGLLTYNDTMEIIAASWAQFYPGKGGFISVNEPSQYTLPPSARKDEYGEYWSISAFHQIHCLQMIMKSWLQFLFKIEQEPSTEHILHCFDYIRMGLMCNGDSALEGSDPFLKARELNGTQGLGSEHVCRDWYALRDWADETTSQQ